MIESSKEKWIKLLYLFVSTSYVLLSIKNFIRRNFSQVTDETLSKALEALCLKSVFHLNIFQANRLIYFYSRLFLCVPMRLFLWSWSLLVIILHARIMKVFNSMLLNIRCDSSMCILDLNPPPRQQSSPTRENHSPWVIFPLAIASEPIHLWKPHIPPCWYHLPS